MKFLTNGVTIIETHNVKAFLPHRWPWNLIKQASHNEEQTWSASQLSRWNLLTLGHFPGNKVIPGVVLMEMLNQLCAIRAQMDNRDSLINHLPQIVGYEGVKIVSPIKPGELFVPSVSTIRTRHPLYIFSGKITKENGQVAMEIKEIKGCAVKVEKK